MKIDLNEDYYLLNFEAEEKKTLYSQALFQRVRQALLGLGFREKENYSIGDLSANDCFLISQQNDFWAVSYYERGLKFRPAFFFDIDDAVHFFIWKVTGGKIFSFDKD